jgi:hypothetical protein
MHPANFNSAHPKTTNSEDQLADRSTPRHENRRRPPILRLPWWFWLAVFDVQFWIVTIPAAIVLALVGWHGAGWLGGLRWAMFGAAALLALPFPAAAVVIVIGQIKAAAYWRTLDRDETVAGLPLPAGSRICFGDKAHSSVVSIDLPHVINIRGMPLVGKLRRYDKWRDIREVWSGTLAEDQRIDGLPCRGGAAGPDKDSFVFDPDGIVQRCTLAAAHELFGLKLPPGTTMMERGNDNKPWTFMLPPDAGVYVAALATTAPPGVTLSVASDGRLEGISSGHGPTIIVRGAPLNSENFRVQGEQVVSELVEPFLVSGEMRPAGTEVRIDLPSGNVFVSGRS